jgi:formamidopyrimidine-DNA glycosylase
MPELPEVETIRRQLETAVTGATVRRVQVLDPTLVAPESPNRFRRTVEGRTVESLGRRGKYLLVGLDSGDTLAMHLRMTGRLHHTPSGRAPADAHRRARFTFGDGSTLDFSDTRRFGRAWIVPADHPDPQGYWRARVGVEPFDRAFTPYRLGTMLAGRSAPVKAAILDQRRVAGVGNIYADEALFQAGVHPARPAGSLDAAEVAALRDAIRDRLRAGIRSGGASIDRYRDTIGKAGTMQDMLRVHRHEGDPCPACGAPVVKIRVAQRGTYLCPECQPAG